MSTAWACHYLRNTPGYANPWDACTEEVVNMLGCVTGLYSNWLTVNFSGYTLGVPDDMKGSLSWFGGSSGVYEVRVNIRDSTTGCSGGYVTFQLVNIDVGSKPIVNTGFFLDKDGYHSGIFAMPSVTGATAYISGYVFAISGRYTGSYNIPYQTQLLDFPAPTLNASFSAVANNATYSFKNNGPIPASGIVERSSDFGKTFSTVQTWWVQSNETTSDIVENLGANYYIYRCNALPSGFAKGISSDVERVGGHPAPALDAVFKWYYETVDADSQKPYIQILVDPANSGSCDDSPPYKCQFTGAGLTTWTDFSSTPVISGDGTYFLFDASDILAYGDGNYYVRIFGASPGSDGTFYSTPIVRGPFDIEGIKAYCESSSIAGCGIEVRWEAKNLGTHAYEVSYSGAPDDMGTVNPELFSYLHDSSAHCGRTYSFQVIRQGTSIKSNIVSCAGSYRLATPVFSINIENIEIGKPERPTTAFNIRLYWDNDFYETHAEYLSGQRTLSSNHYYDAQVLIRYDNAKESSDGPFPLAASPFTSIGYDLFLVSGIELATPISGYSLPNWVEIGRTPQKPTITSCTKAGNDVTVTWNGSADETIWEYYAVQRSNGTDTVSFDVARTTTVYHDNGLSPGFYTYQVECRNAKPDNPKFIALSDFSDPASITIP